MRHAHFRRAWAPTAHRISDLREVGSSILGSVHEPARPSSPTDRLAHRCGGPSSGFGGERGGGGGARKAWDYCETQSRMGPLTGSPHQEKPHGMACSCGTLFNLAPPDCWLGPELVRGGGGRADLRSGGAAAAAAVGCPRPAAARDQESVHRVPSDENAPRRPGASRENSFLEG